MHEWKQLFFQSVSIHDYINEKWIEANKPTQFNAFAIQMYFFFVNFIFDATIATRVNILMNDEVHRAFFISKT